ncbi:hypothetical protein HO173_001611 [Letharia columbiana]|uniref:Uncharacterized protein n=1 Tax=Letharia columbiana TaxID=112416 RepID=A0A8H6G3Q3_9LECA|nr:uncharacterized protein HO173_001611 [Letharia columbiana]KAF6240003.1 hypothetical protein HO173_001611 [Letharia columbiana]
MQDSIPDEPLVGKQSQNGTSHQRYVRRIVCQRSQHSAISNIITKNITAVMPQVFAISLQPVRQIVNPNLCS